MSGPEAAEVAGVTYRMLDYWHRQGWVTAPCAERFGRTRVVRRYDDTAVLRLGAMRHLALSGLDVARHGPQVGEVDLTGPVVMAVGSLPDDVVEVVAEDQLRQLVARPGRWVVFDPAPLRAKLRRRAGAIQETADGGDMTSAVRRSA